MTFHAVVSCKPVAPVAFVLAKYPSSSQPSPILLTLIRLQPTSANRVPLLLLQDMTEPTQYWPWKAIESAFTKPWQKISQVQLKSGHARPSPLVARMVAA